MVVFPNAKINIGLDILKKREDGFHEIESILYPIGLKDIIEIIPISNNKTGIDSFTISGIRIDGSTWDNLIFKAYSLLLSDYKIPSIKIHLHKVIPFGAGLGGGSADASFTLNLLNNLFSLGISNDKLKEYSLELGSDCPFFIDNKPALAKGRGEILSHVDVDLKGKYLLLIVPDIHVSTAEAYSNVKPGFPNNTLLDNLSKPTSHWKESIKNDFEDSIFPAFPRIEGIKSTLYNMGALYASLSGSGSSVFGIFNEKPNYDDEFQGLFLFGELL